jgi:6-pyruvoyltetrahydropterin/6-carboxytetrahydropterin synthase
MYQISRKFSFSYAHRLLEYEGKCARLHGHNARVVVTLSSEGLDRNGMIMDFHGLKQTAGRWIDETIDHRTILHRSDPLVVALRSAGEEPYLVDFSPTAERLSHHIYQKLSALGLPVTEIVFDETVNCAASYRPDGEALSH